MRPVDEKQTDTQAQSESSESFLNLAEYWRVIWRRKLFVILPLVIGGLVTVVGVRFLVPIYVSSSLIRMERRSAINRDVAQILQVQGQRRAQDRENLSRLRTELQSTAFVDQIIRHFELDKKPSMIEDARLAQQERFPELTVEEIVFRRLREFLRENISVENKGPWLFEIACYDSDPENSFLLASAVTNLFVENLQKKQLRATREVGEFTDKQLEIHQSRLEKAESELEQAKRRISQNRLVGNPIGEENIQLGENQLRQLNIRVDEQIQTLSNVKNNLRTVVGMAPQTRDAILDGELRNLEDRLDGRREAQLLIEVGSGDGSGDELDQTMEDIAETELEYQRHLAVRVASVYPNLHQDFRPLMIEYHFVEANLQILEQKRDKLAEYIEAYKRNKHLMPQLELELESKSEEVETYRAVYESFVKARTSTQVSEAAQNTQLAAEVEIVEPPDRPITPARPNKLKIIIFGIFLGGAIGFGSLLVSEFMDMSFKSVGQIEKQLGVPVVGTVPNLETAGALRKKDGKGRKTIWLAASIVLITLISAFYFYGKQLQKKTITIQDSRHTQARD